MKSSRKEKVDKIRSIGLYTKGSVYVLIGLLTAMAAIGLRNEVEGRSGVVDFILGQPAGKLLVGIVALGLFCYSLWRLFQCIKDPESDNGENRVGVRLKALYSGLIYGFIAVGFARPLIGTFSDSNNSNGSNGDTKQAALSKILSTDWGSWVIGAIAVAVAIQAGYQIYRGISEKFMHKIDDQPENKARYKTVKNIGRVGYISRGIVFGILSFFLFKVIAAHSADEYEGTKGAFQWLLSFQYGQILTGAVALGLLAYGVFTILVARYSDLTEIS